MIARVRSFAMRRRLRLKLATLMLLVAGAALLAAWLRPMTRREAVRVARRWAETEARSATPRPLDPGPRRWEVWATVMGHDGSYFVILESDGPGQSYEAGVRVSAHRRVIGGGIHPSDLP